MLHISIQVTVYIMRITCMLYTDIEYLSWSLLYRLWKLLYI